MALDGIMLSKVVTDLSNYLPMRINKIYGVNKSEVLFHINANRENKVLLVSCEPSSNRIHFTNKDYTHQDFPNNFVMLLRKHLLNGIITAIKQNDYDRHLKMTITNRNSIGDQVSFNIYIELLGRFANMIFCDEEDVIFDAIKRISPIENPKAAIIPGATYQISTPQDKKNPFTESNFDINESLVKQFSGFSPTLDKEVKFRISNNESFAEIINKLKNSKELVITTKGKKTDYHTLELKHLKGSSKSYPIHKGFDKLYYDLALKKRIENETRNISRFLNREIKKTSKKLVKLEDQLEKNKNADINLKYGDLILTYQGQIKKGMKFTNLIDYETNEPITINLDERLDAVSNSQKYYKKYRKQTNSIKHLKNQIKLANKDLDYFNLLLDQLEYADINSAIDIKQELIDNKYLFEKTKKKQKGKKRNKPNFLSIQYDQDTLIRVGKTNVQNDYVTFKASNRNDYWFHVQDYHGAHVSVATNNLSNDIIEVCATLATYFSKARNSKNVAVNYTQIKNIKKIPKASLGMVSLDTYQTVTIENDFDLIKDFVN